MVTLIEAEKRPRSYGGYGGNGRGAYGGVSVQGGTQNNSAEAKIGRDALRTETASTGNAYAPRKVNKVFLRVPSIESREAKKAVNLIEIFDGETPVAFYETESKKYLSFNLALDATPFVIGELKKLLGEENVAVK